MKNFLKIFLFLLFVVLSIILAYPVQTQAAATAAMETRVDDGFSYIPAIPTFATNFTVKKNGVPGNTFAQAMFSCSILEGSCTDTTTCTSTGRTCRYDALDCLNATPCCCIGSIVCNNSTPDNVCPLGCEGNSGDPDCVCQGGNGVCGIGCNPSNDSDCIVCTPNGCGGGCPANCTGANDPDCAGQCLQCTCSTDTDCTNTCAAGNGCCPGCPLADPDCRLINPLSCNTFGECIEVVINFVFGIGIIVAPLVFVIGGFFYITSAGDPNRIRTATKIMIYAIIGLFLILLSRGIISIIRNFPD